MHRTFVLTFLLLGWTATALAQNQIRTVNHTFDLDPDATVLIETYKGSITVTPWERPEVEVEIRIEAEDLDGIVMLPHVEIHTEQDENGLHFETDYRKAQAELLRIFSDAELPRLPLVHYTLRMPRTALLQIEDYMSQINVTDLQSPMEVFTYKGIVDLVNVGGALKLDTVIGTARVAFSYLTRDSSIDTHEGNIAIRLPHDAAFDLDVALGQPSAIFSPDTTFSTLRAIDRHQNYSGPINGGGPRLNLATERGSFMLGTL